MIRLSMLPFQVFRPLNSHLLTNVIPQSGQESWAAQNLTALALSLLKAVLAPSKSQQAGPVASGAEQAATSTPPATVHVLRRTVAPAKSSAMVQEPHRLPL